MTRCTLLLVSRIEMEGMPPAFHTHREIHKGTITECSLEAERVLTALALEKERAGIAATVAKIRAAQKPVYPRFSKQ